MADSFQKEANILNRLYKIINELFRQKKGYSDKDKVINMLKQAKQHYSEGISVIEEILQEIE